MKIGAVLILLILLAADQMPVRAQTPALQFSAGPVVPLGSMSESYNAGRAGGMSLSHGVRNGGFGVRAELWGARFTTETIQSDFWNVSVLGSVLYAFSQEGPRPYVLFGVAGYRQLRDDGHDPYGWVPGLQTGVGLSWPIGEVELSVEVQYQVILSDLVSGCDFCFATQMPLTFGIGL